MPKFTEVTRSEFLKAIYEKGLDVHPRITTEMWPYTCMWEFHRKPDKPIYGKTVGHSDGSKAYFVFESGS